MSQQQVALLTLEKISYIGADVGVNFTININAASESNDLQMTLMQGATTTMTENLGGLEVDPANAPFTMPVTVGVSGTYLGQPVSGAGSTTVVIQASPPEQTYSMQINVASVIGPSATFTFHYRLRYREYPVSYDPEWLCRNRYNWSAFQRWLCLGYQQLVDFNSRLEVTYLHQTFLDYTPRLQRISNELSLGFTASGSGFFDVQTFTFDVVMGAALSVSSMKWGRRYTLDDFVDTVDDRMEDYLISVHPVLDFQVLELCRRWRELLDCFCRFCMRRPALPLDAVSYYDTSIAPHVDLLYQALSPIASSEGMPATLAPISPTINCDKLRFIVSFWAWYCRRCPLISPVWAPSLESYYTTLYDKRALLNDILEANNWKLCNPPEKNFCTRWLDILNCLKKLCNARGDLPTALRNDIESTFGTVIRSLATFLKLPGIAGLMGPGVDNTCALLAKLRPYFDTLCPAGAVPGGRIRRTQLDTLLVQIESAMTGFKLRNGDLCAAGIPMTRCDEWQTVLNCLKHLCSEKNLFNSDLRSAILSGFQTPIDDLMAIAFPTPPTPPAGYTGIDLLCFKINQLSAFITDRCPDNPIDPIVKLRLEAKLAALQSAYDALLVAFPDICSTTVTITTTWCDSWIDIIDCLKRICKRSDDLNPAILDGVESEFGSVIDELLWVANGAGSPFTSDPFTWEEICDSLDALKAYINGLCTAGAIDPVLKLRLDALLARLQTAYSNLLVDYPGICNEPDEFCEQWIEVLDCFARLCDRLRDQPADQLAANTLALAVERLGAGMSITYGIVFGYATPGTFDTPRDKFCFEVHALLDWFTDHCSCCGGTVSETLRNNLFEVVLMVVNEYQHLVACEPSCTTSSLTLVTGTAPWMVTRVDGVLLDEPGPVNIVTGTGGIGSPISGSDWISPHTTADDDVEGLTSFQRCFCVCTPGDVQVQITYWADDTADIYLDNTIVHLASTQNMPVSESQTITLAVTAGRHCIRAEVKNDPAFNMAFCATGTITAVTATLLADECCGDATTPLPPCADIPLQCEKITALPRMYQFLCCPQRIAGDPLYNTAEYTDLVNGLTCFEGEIGPILYVLGEVPENYPLVGVGFCARMRRVMRVMMRGYRSYAALPALVRRKLDCFHTLLREKVSTLAYTEVDYPAPCSETCAICTKWVNLVECLCKVCSLRPQIGATHPALAAQIDDLLCEQKGMPSGGKSLVSYNCCEDMLYTFAPVLDKCFCCTEAMAELLTYEETYDWYNTQYQALATALAAAGYAPCENACAKWYGMLECLVKICLRRNELPTALRESFDATFSGRAAQVYSALFNTSPPASPFAADAFGTTCWTLLGLMRTLARYCSPLYFWDPNVALALAARLADFSSAYATYMASLANAGIHFCDENADVCERLRHLPELYRIVCATAPNAASGPIIALNALLGQMAPEVPHIQRQLALPQASYPTNLTFCDRLQFVVNLMGTAYVRGAELAARYRVMVDLFDSIMTAQANAYAWEIQNDLPRPTTAMAEYREQWTELLNCICRACRFVAGLDTNGRTTYQTIVSKVETQGSGLGLVVNDLYGRVLALSAQLDIPIGPDACATTLCDKLRAATSFFAIYCLRCDAPDALVVSTLDSALDPLRAATVDLRGALVNAGQYLCIEENPENVLIQSQELYLQAAGSTGADGSSPGTHLRWALVDLLAEHLPKGTLAGPGTAYHGTNALNRKDDFVRVYRVPYGPNQRFAAVIDLAVTMPDDISGSTDPDAEVVWTYNNVHYDTTFNDTSTTVQVTFNGGAYPASLPVAKPYTAHVQQVLLGYSGVYKVEAESKLMFAVEVDITGAQGTPSVKFEAISRNDDPSVEDPNFVSARIQVTGATNPHRVESESVEYVLFQCTGCRPAVIRVETFDDFYAGSKRHYLLKRFGAYALSLDDNEVYKRLEDPGKYTIDGTWPKFATDLAGAAAAPVMRARVDNYKDRWIPRTAAVADPVAGIYNRPMQQSLRAALVKYLDKSKEATNVLAWSTESSLLAGDKTEMNISLLQLLQLAAQDFHIARMLGLGAIDWQATDTSKRYVYVAEYTADDPAHPGEAPSVHRYLSLPTGPTDARLPVVPALKPLVKGLDPPYTDAEGYTRFGTYRYMQVFRDDLNFDLPVGEFFSGPNGFGRGIGSRPILFGIKYGSMINEGDIPLWDIPDPSNDASDTAPPTYHPYIDKAGKPEVVAIPDLQPIEGKPVPALFTHRIPRTSEARPWHKYAIYGINWFSRVSPSVESGTFHNNFPVLNTLQPPLNLRTQYLQYEDAPMLNAPSENNSGYFGKTRVTFDWNHLHDIAYQFADEVHFYARTAEPKRLRGKIVDVDLSEAEPLFAWITTDSYDEYDRKTPVTVAPVLAVEEGALYLGSMLVTPTNRFEILQAVRDTGNNNYAWLRVKAEVVQELGPDGTLQSGDVKVPLVGELFLAVENLNTINDNALGLPGWRRLDQHKVKLAQFPKHTEQIVTEGRSEAIQVGGLVHPATTIVKRTGTDVDGLYDVTMIGVALGTYTDYATKPAHLEIGFYKGTFRVNDPKQPGKVRALEVLKIVQEAPDLKLLVFDPEDRLLSEGAVSPQWANFHPSYRFYVQWSLVEAIDPVASFEPVDPELSRLTYMAAKAVHTVRVDGNGDVYRSSPTPPAVHLARAIQQPLAPAVPLGPTYASRPDFYGKASYTFDTAIAPTHVPYGMFFYRADEMALLLALYRLSTITNDIVPYLPEQRSDDPFLEARWQGLLQVTLEGDGSKRFKAYGGFRFPLPDKGLEVRYAGPYKDDFNNVKLPGDMVDAVKEALHNAFVPLTSSYVALRDVKTSPTLQTSPKKPTLRRSNGEPLDQSIPEDLVLYDPYPMIRLSDPADVNKRVRFTDYTLDGASRNVYFYCTREVSSGLGAGAPSPVKGPVRLVNTAPPIAPAILKVRAQPENAVLETKPEVSIQLNPPPAGERIRRIWLYRALNDADARTLRTMKQLPEIVLAGDLPTDVPFEVRDRFADLAPGESIPYGGPIYYRVVIGRRITNEHGDPEYVMSVPSETVLVSIKDTVNPKAPTLDMLKQVVTAPAPDAPKPLKFTDVKLEWDQTTYNATYRLYKMSPQGQWTLVTTVAPPHAPGKITYDWSADSAHTENPDLLKLDENHNVIYHRFKVVVINSSGLVSIVDEILVI